MAQQAVAAPRIVIVGGGKMGEAILAGWLASDEGPAAELGLQNFLVVNPGEERRAYLTEKYKVACVADVAEVEEALQGVAADVVILAVKPQVMPGVLRDIASLAPFQRTDEGPLFVSIAAGLTTDVFEAALPQGSPVVRTMPNTPLQVGAGATGVCGGANATADQVGHVRDLFGCLGRAVVVTEDKMDAVGALSGSGPAYVAAMIEALTAAAANAGLDEQLAAELALQTVFGTARMIDETGVTAEQARVAVCSPGGTTLAALAAMDEAGFAGVFDAGIRAAIVRSKELAAC